MHTLRQLMPILNALLVFEEAGRQNSFTHAGRKLGMAQPSVSRFIANLESHLGRIHFMKAAVVEIYFKASHRIARQGAGFHRFHDPLLDRLPSRPRAPLANPRARRQALVQPRLLDRLRQHVDDARGAQLRGLPTLTEGDH